MTFAHVQTPSGGSANSSATSITVSMPSVAAGSLLVCAWRYSGGGRTVTCSDDKGGTWANAGTGGVDTADSNSTCGISYSAGAAGGTTVVTFGVSGGAVNLRMLVSEFSASTGGVTLDQYVQAGLSSTATPNAGSLTPGVNGELLYVAMHCATAGTGLAAGTDFTITTTVPTGVGTERLIAERFIQTTAAAHDGNLSLDVGHATTWGAAYATFKETAGGTNATPTVAVATFTIPTPVVDVPINATPTAAAAAFVIPTPAVKVGIWKVSDRGVRNSTSTGTATITLTNPTLIAAGNYLVARVAVDNSGASGARPGLAVTDSRSHTWTAPSGALQDPGAASAGAAAYLCYVKVVTPFQAADTVVFTWTTGSPISAIVIEEWAGIDPTTPAAVAQTTGNNVSSTAQPSIARTPTAAGQLMYAMCAAEQLGSEWGAQDSDTTDGSWSEVTKDSANTGTHDTSMSVYGGYKVVTGTSAQTWNNTLGTTGDWAAVAIVFGPQILERVLATAPVAAFVIPTPSVTTPPGNPAPTAVAATFTIPAPGISVSLGVTAAAATFTVPTPAVTVTTTPSPTAVSATFVAPTPGVTVTTTPSPTVAAQTWTIPTPVVSTSVSATLTAVAQTWTIPTPVPTVQTNVAVTAVAGSFTIPTPTIGETANPPATAVAQTWVIPTPSVTTGSNTSIGATAVAATYVIPTPAIAGTQVAPTAPAQTWVVGTATISTSVNVTVTAVAMVATIPTPTFTRTTIPTPTAVAMICAVPTPGYTASANILATVLAAVFAIRQPTLGGVLAGGSVSAATRAQVGAGTALGQPVTTTTTAQTGTGTVSSP